MTIVPLVDAQDEAFDAARKYQRQQPGLGDQFEAEVATLLGRLSGMPRMYAEVDPPVRGREVRDAPVGRFSYTIVYEVRPTELIVVAVAHTSRRPQYWLRRLP